MKLQQLTCSATTIARHPAAISNVAALATCLIAGVVIAVAPVWAMLGLAAVLSIGLYLRLGGTVLAVAPLMALVALGYGANNVPAGTLPIPAVDLLLLLFLAISARYWAPGVSLGGTFLPLLACALLWVLAIVRLYFDIPVYGQLAGRDALFIFEIPFVLVGVALGSRYTSRQLVRGLRVCCLLLTLWYATYPFRDVITSISPTVGIQRPVPLVDYTMIGVTAVSTFIFFILETHRRVISYLGATLSLAAVAMSQLKGSYLGLLLAVTAVGIMARFDLERQRASSSIAARATLAVATGIVILAALPPLPGRLAQVSMAAAIDQVRGLTDQSSLGGDSVEIRKRWMAQALSAVRQSPEGPLVGVGFGTDLTGGFRTAGGIVVRKPHNDFLEVYGRLGLVGLAVFALLVGSMVRWSVRLASSNFQLGAWILGSQVVCLVTAATQPFFGFGYGAVPFYVVSGLALGAWAREAPLRPPRESRAVPDAR